MTEYRTPPNKSGLVLNNGDDLEVRKNSEADHTTINDGGRVFDYGTDKNTTINAGGKELVYGVSTLSTINHGGAELVRPGGETNLTQIKSGGVETVYDGGKALGTTIYNGGTEIVAAHGTADNVIFAGNAGTLKLDNAAGLIGTLSNWRIGDVIDLANTVVTEVRESGNILTVYYGGQEKALYTLAGEQANTQVSYHSDGHGGTDLVLTPIVGAQALHDFHHLFG
jgi:autotransporter passenger strand-loop-strand repeat protein